MRRLNLPRALRDVRETINPAARDKKIDRHRNRALFELTDRRKRRDRLAVQLAYLERHPGQQDGANLQILGLWVLAVIVLAADVPVQLLLNSAALPGVHTWKVFLGSAGLALLISGATHGALLAFTHDSDRPGRAVRISLGFAWIAGAASAIAAGIVLFARLAGSAEAAHLVTAVTVALWVAAEALPLAGGGFSSAAHLLSWPAAVAKENAENEDRIAALERFLKELQEETITTTPEHHAGSDGHPSGSTKSAPTTAFLPTLTAVGLILLAPPLRADCLCGVWVDRTLSLDSGRRAEAIQLFEGAFPDLVHSFECTEVLVGSFADDGEWAERRWLIVPQEPRARDCAEDTTHVDGTQRVLNKLQGFRDHFHDQALTACEEERAAARASYELAFREFLDQVRAVLEQPQLDVETSTDIVGVLRTTARHGARVVVVLTDAIDTTRKDVSHVSIERLPQVVFVLVPASAASGGPHRTRAAAAAWQRMIPSAAMIPYVELADPVVFHRVAADSP